jgi:hypothetical protein
MTRNLDIPKASPESTARAILDGVEKEEEEIFPDPMSEAIAEGWRGSPSRRSSASLLRTSNKRPSNEKACGAWLTCSKQPGH